LYCGKEIGAIRQVHDAEFCCSAHRRSYSTRLSKIVQELSLAEAAPAPAIGFFSPVRVQSGTVSRTCAGWKLGAVVHEICHIRSVPVSIQPVLGQRLRVLAGAAAAPAPHAQARPVA
jgi:hypothetical protein